MPRNFWTEREDKIVLEMMQDELDPRFISERLGRPIESVRARIQLLKKSKKRAAAR